MTKRKIEYWVIPPDADGEFVANMEEVLETYAEAYDPRQSGGVHGRATGAIAEGDARADRRDEGASRSGSITNTNATGRPASSCSPNRCRASAKRRPGPQRTKVDWAHRSGPFAGHALRRLRAR